MYLINIIMTFKIKFFLNYNIILINEIKKQNIKILIIKL